MVDYYESPNVKDENTSYLTSVILTNEILEKNDNLNNMSDLTRRILLIQLDFKHIIIWIQTLNNSKKKKINNMAITWSSGVLKIK